MEIKRKRTSVLLRGLQLRTLDIRIWRIPPCPHWTNPLLLDCGRHFWTALNPLSLSCLLTLYMLIPAPHLLKRR